MLNGKEKPIRTFKSNGQPILMPTGLIPENLTTKDLTQEKIARRAAQIRENIEFKKRVSLALAGRYKVMEPSPHVEEKIFDGFFSNIDTRLMAQFQLGDWEEKLAVARQLEDPRLREIARRQIYFEQPDLLSKTVRKDLDGWIVNRLSIKETSVPWRTIPDAIAEADKLSRNTNIKDKASIGLVKEFILGLV